MERHLMNEKMYYVKANAQVTLAKTAALETDDRIVFKSSLFTPFIEGLSALTSGFKLLHFEHKNSTMEATLISGVTTIVLTIGSEGSDFTREQKQTMLNTLHG